MQSTDFSVEGAFVLAGDEMLVVFPPRAPLWHPDLRLLQTPWRCGELASASASASRRAARAAAG
eukprot:3182377-Pyramimonas_sp.AAC.1